MLLLRRNDGSFRTADGWALVQDNPAQPRSPWWVVDPDGRTVDRASTFPGAKGALGLHRRRRQKGQRDGT